jgi:hypothetical protein
VGRKIKLFMEYIMVGPIAQNVSLISFGNETLSAGDTNADYKNNSTFHHCNSVLFIFGKGYIPSDPNKIAAADHPKKWFKRLKNEGCKKLRLIYQPSNDPNFPDYQLAGYVDGGGTWLIEAIYSEYSDFWKSQWEVNNRGDINNKIWSITYKKIAEKQSIVNFQEPLDNIKEELKNILTDIAKFTRDNNVHNWTGTNWLEQFNTALKIFESSEPKEEYYHKDLLVNKNYSLLAQQIIFAAGKSWVFGGMGSWNDLGFEDNHIDNEYHYLTEKLYKITCRAIVAAVNSF